MRFLFLIAFMFSGSAPAETVEVYFLYRPALRSSQVLRHVIEKKETAGWPQMWEIVRHRPIQNLSDLKGEQFDRIQEIVETDPRSWGHVAIELPVGARPGGTVFGWEPDREAVSKLGVEEQKLLLHEMLEPGHPPKAIRGKFEVAGDWVGGSGYPESVPVLEVKITLTQTQLAAMIKKMDSMDADPAARYQLSNESRTLAPSAFNCATAAGYVFETAGVRLDFIPGDGSMMALHRALLGTSTPRHFRCGNALGNLLSP